LLCKLLYCENLASGAGLGGTLLGGNGNETLVAGVGDRADGGWSDLGQIDAQPGVAGNQDFVLVDRFSGIGGQLRFKQHGAEMLVLADFNGDRLADFAIPVQGVTNLTAADFVL
jgi:hypothetical protein